VIRPRSGPLGPDSIQAAGLTMVRACCSSNMAGLRYLRLSIGTEWGPRIGLQKGPLCGLRWRARAWSTQSRRRSGERAREAGLRSGLGSGAVLEAPALVAGLDDVAVVGQPVLASPKTLGHSPKAGLVVTIAELRS